MIYSDDLFLISNMFLCLNFKFVVSHMLLEFLFFFMYVIDIGFFIFLKQRRRLITHANAKSKSEKFPPPHQDGALGFPLGSSHHIDPAFLPPDVPFSTTSFTYSKEPIQTWSGPLVDSAGATATRRKKHAAGDSRELSKPPTGTGKDRSSHSRIKGKKNVI